MLHCQIQTAAENAPMKKNTFHKDIQGYSKKILLRCEKVQGKYHKKTLHTLRVNFKTLRALLRWQHAETEKLVTPFRSVYHVAGDIRNAGLLLDFIVAHKMQLPSCKRWITNERKKYRQAWRKIYDKKEIEKCVHQIKKSAIEYRQNDLFF